VRVTGQYVMNGADAIVRAYLLVDSPLAYMPSLILGTFDAKLIAQDAGDPEPVSGSRVDQGLPTDREPRGRGVIVCPWNGSGGMTSGNVSGGQGTGFLPGGQILPQPYTGQPGLLAVAAAALARRALEADQVTGAARFGPTELDRRLKLARAAEAREIRARLRAARDAHERDEILNQIRAIRHGAAQAFDPQDAGSPGTQIIGHFRATWSMQQP
jgi:hypothetical protein